MNILPRGMSPELKSSRVVTLTSPLELGGSSFSIREEEPMGRSRYPSSVNESLSAMVARRRSV